jgi:6,7-dimethyl-8-ribityllumazine synthase
MRDVLTLEGSHRAPGMKFAVVVSKFNDFVTERLQAGALDGLKSAGVGADDICVIKVPGAFEIPFAAKEAATRGRFAAVVCLGCLIRGATPHFEYISSACAQGITNAAAATGVPMTFGVLTTNSVEEALERAVEGPANKGWEAAIAAVEMATLQRAIRQPGPPIGEII